MISIHRWCAALVTGGECQYRAMIGGRPADSRGVNGVSTFAFSVELSGSARYLLYRQPRASLMIVKVFRLLLKHKGGVDRFE
jgi:hypothetical protein